MNNYIIEYSTIILSGLLVLIVFTIGFYFTVEKRNRDLLKFRLLSFKEIENERKRITSEIHDTTNLLIYKLRNDLSEIKSPNKNPIEGKYDKVIVNFISEFNNTISNLSDKIYPKYLLLESWAESINLMCKLFENQVDIDCEINVNTKLNDIQYHETYRIIQETIVNAINHEQPKFLQVFIDEYDKKMIIEILYPLTEENSNKKQGTGRGKFIIEERLKLLNAKYSKEVEKYMNIEKITFKIK